MTAPPARPDHGPTADAANAALLAEVADALAWPLLLLQRDGLLLHANLAGRQLLQHGQPLQLNAQRAVQPSAAAHQAAFAAALQDPSPQPRLLLWPGAHGFTATLSPLPAPAPGDQAMLLALGAPPAQGIDLQAFARLHGLSAAETRVLARLARGESSRQAAAALGVAPATVRAQAASLRRKTGHRSVPALLRALSALPPLARPPAREGY